MPALYAPTASNTLLRSSWTPFLFSDSIGPPLTTTEGTFILAAAISMPGTILSQLGMNTMPSKLWARPIASHESAISSLDASEYFIPICPMAMPSHIPMLPNSTGVPPAILIPALTASAILSRCMCPGTISFLELTTPISGLLISSSVYPMALNSALCGAFSMPFLTISLFIENTCLSCAKYLNGTPEVLPKQPECDIPAV